MHDQAPVEASAPPPAIDDHSNYLHQQQQHHHHHDTPPPPDSPPPSYDDATNSATAPLLAGAPPGYGTTFPDQSSIASSEVEETDRSLPEWLGQILVVFIFVSLIYGFWRIINAPDRSDGFPR